MSYILDALKKAAEQRGAGTTTLLRPSTPLARVNRLGRLPWIVLGVLVLLNIAGALYLLRPAPTVTPPPAPVAPKVALIQPIEPPAPAPTQVIPSEPPRAAAPARAMEPPRQIAPTQPIDPPAPAPTQVIPSEPPRAAAPARAMEPPRQIAPTRPAEPSSGPAVRPAPPSAQSAPPVVPSAPPALPGAIGGPAFSGAPPATRTPPGTVGGPALSGTPPTRPPVVRTTPDARVTIARPDPSLPAAVAPAPTRADAQRFKLEVLSYSDVPAQRLVFINGRRYREGEMLDGAVKVEEIREDSVILSEAGQRFTLR